MMKKPLVIIIFISCFALLLTSCAKIRKPLTISARQQIQSDHLVTNTDQRAIKPIVIIPNPPVIPTASLLVGLVTAVIASGIDSAVADHREHVANKEIKKVRSALAGYNFSQQFIQQLTNKLNNIKWLKITDTSSRHNAVRKNVLSFLQFAQDNALLYLSFSYQMSPNFNIMQVLVKAGLYEKDKRYPKGYRTLYYNQFTFLDKLSKHHQWRAWAVPKWIRNNGQRLRNGLILAADSLTNSIVYDISNPAPNLYQKLSNKPTIGFYDVMGHWRSGKLFAEQNGYYALRVRNGSVFIVNKHDLGI